MPSILTGFLLIQISNWDSMSHHASLQGMFANTFWKQFFNCSDIGKTHLALETNFRVFKVKCICCRLIYLFCSCFVGLHWEKMLKGKRNMLFARKFHLKMGMFYSQIVSMFALLVWSHDWFMVPMLYVFFVTLFFKFTKSFHITLSFCFLIKTKSSVWNEGINFLQEK